jgi:hypothetical protein
VNSSPLSFSVIPTPWFQIILNEPHTTAMIVASRIMLCSVQGWVSDKYLAYKNTLGDIIVDNRIILKWMLRK